MRVVSFLPSATEIVAALGRLDAIVGVSHECDYPDGVRAREVVTATGIDSHAPPDVVDGAVRRFVDAGRPLYDVRADRVRALAPDVLITQAVCDVCAVSEGDVRAVAAALEPRPEVVSLGATTLEGIFDDVRRVAMALGVPERADALVGDARERMRAVHETLKTAQAPRPRVAVLEWTDPVFAAGHWVPEMVRRAGGVDVLAEPGQRSATRTVGAVCAARPDVLIIAPCGYDLERAAADGTRLLDAPEWSWAHDLPAWAVDANALFSRPGPRVIDGIEQLARILHPGLFPPPAPSSACPLSMRQP